MTENQSTPDGGQGFDSSAPEQNSGFSQDAIPAAQSNGFGEPQGVGSTDNVQTSEQFANYEKRISDTQRKMHEQSQQLADYNRQIQGYEQKNQQFGQTLAQHFGVAQPEQQQDLVSTLIDNPNYINDMLKQAKDEIRNEYRQEFGVRDSKEYLSSEQTSKEQIKQQLSANMSPQMVDQMLDISSLVNPHILQLNQSLNDPTLDYNQRAQLEQRLQVEFAQELQNRGGYSSLVRQKAGEMLMGNFNGLMQDAATVHQKKQFSSSRAGAMMNYRNGAQTTEGGSRYRTQSISR